MLRNALIREGLAPGRVQVAARGVVNGRRSGARIVTRRPVPTTAAKGSDEPIGESHFETRLPMTVAKGTSAMVSVVSQGTIGAIVYLFDPDAKRQGPSREFDSAGNLRRRRQQARRSRPRRPSAP